MVEERQRPSDENLLSRLAGRGEDALTRLVDELGRNSRVTDALARAMAAKGKVDETTRRTLGQVGLAPADEVRDLRARVSELEARLAKLEAAEAQPTTRRAGRKPATSTKASGGTPKASPSSASTSRPRSGGTPPEAVS
jgi:polyhydroxyalkanoate synthesis regulator phasin